MNTRTGIGIIGGGLMGREVASALARWFVLDNHPVQPELLAVCDPLAKPREWFRRVPTVKWVAADHHEMLARPEIDVVYVAVPHSLHERICLDVLAAGKDLLAEKPFGIDLRAARAMAEAAKNAKRFVRCSSEFPFLPGGQRVFKIARDGKLGRLLEIRAGFLHSSDLDPEKPANWKRQAKTCGEIGVMGDLGLHVAHIPFRLGWKPKRVFAELQKFYPLRPDGAGGMAPCDTWDNATLHTAVEVEGHEVPMRFEMKRLAPGETNTWFIEILGTDGGVKYSTKEPKTLWTFQRWREQSWLRTDLGFHGPYPTITGGIFEPGFPDCYLQMWAAYLAERSGALEGRFGCVTPEEAVLSHQLFAAALQSQLEKKAISLD
ncbi:MAG TPA: Gfo/Idh/MocA family oxidoreductase [Candidatus Acidoferrum sp.]|nr:Gfo/Idh/MocA family oxidoreductase [Candidatus Acidoferrum sp.]